MNQVLFDLFMSKIKDNYVSTAINQGVTIYLIEDTKTTYQDNNETDIYSITGHFIGIINSQLYIRYSIFINNQCYETIEIPLHKKRISKKAKDFLKLIKACSAKVKKQEKLAEKTGFLKTIFIENTHN
jgi:hypothetical protein